MRCGCCNSKYECDCTCTCGENSYEYVQAIQPKLNKAIKALEIISNQGFWSTKMTAKAYSKLLDEYKETADQALQEIKE